ncbi:MAG: hypothetical protein AAGF75_00090 [Cyanobacteria bacterium P01_H01_bin.130]
MNTNGKERPATVGTVVVGDGRALLHHARQWLAAPENRDRVVITPSPQAARALDAPRRSLDQWAQRKIHPWHTASVIVTHRLIRAAVVNYWQTTDPAATAQRILPTLRQYLRAGIDLEALRDCESVSTRSRQIAQIAIAYRTQLRSRRLIDEAELFAVALDKSGDREAGAPMLFHGYPWPGNDEAALMAAIAPVGSVVGVDPVAEEAIAIFRQAGWAIVELSETETSPTQLQAYAFPNAAAEVRWALGQVKQWLLAGVPPQQIALVARDERTYGEWLADVAWDYETPVRLLFSIPLATTRIGGWVQNLLEAATSNFPFETTAKLLRHPLCGYAIEVDPGLAATVAEKQDEDEDDSDPGGDRPVSPSSSSTGESWWHLARQRHPEGLNAWAGIGIDLKTWLEPADRKQSRADWVSWLDGVIAQGQLQRRAANWAREAAAIAMLRHQLLALEQFQESRSTPNETTDAPSSLLTLSQFAEEMRDVLSLATVPAEPGRAGVELHQPRAMAGSAYDHVIVLGAMEGTLPAPIVNDPVVDFYERKRLTRAGFPLESAVTLARREWHHFQSTVAAGRSLTLTYPKLVGKEEQLPSPYLDHPDLALAIAPGPEHLPANWSDAYGAFLNHRDRLTDAFTEDHCLVLEGTHHAWTV